MSETGVVYQIINRDNGKIYVGCTSNLGSRIASHFIEARRQVIDSEFYKDLRTSPCSFVFGLLEIDVPCEIIKERETAWIVKLDSISTGYNQVRVSGNEKLSKPEVEEIKGLLQYSDFKFSHIAEMHGVSASAISDINLGRAWLNPDCSYPLRRGSVKRIRLTVDEILAIYEQLKNPTLSFSQIASQYGWSSEAVIRKINNGTYSVSPLPPSSYPIRPVDSRKGRRKKDNGIV